MFSKFAFYGCLVMMAVFNIAICKPSDSRSDYPHSCIGYHENFCGEHGECNMEEDYCQCDREYEGHKCQNLRLVRCSRTVIDYVVNEIKCPDGFHCAYMKMVACSKADNGVEIGCSNGLYCAYSNLNCYVFTCKLAEGYCLPVDEPLMRK